MLEQIQQTIEEGQAQSEEAAQEPWVGAGLRSEGAARAMVRRCGRCRASRAGPATRRGRAGGGRAGGRTFQRQHSRCLQSLALLIEAVVSHALHRVSSLPWLQVHQGFLSQYDSIRPQVGLAC